MATIYDEIKAERAAQDAQWGAAHDDIHFHGQWVALIEDYARKARMSTYLEAGGESVFRRRMVQVAALAVAAIESLDRKNAAVKP